MTYDHNNSFLLIKVAQQQLNVSFGENNLDFIFRHFLQVQIYPHAQRAAETAPALFSTAELMSQFYQEFANAQVTKAEALHRAQLALLAEYQIPYFWVPYVLVGNWL